MRNVFNFCTVYHALVDVATLQAALAHTRRVIPRGVDRIQALQFSERSAIQDLPEAVGLGLMGVLKDAVVDALDTDEVFAELYTVQMDVDLMDVRIAHLINWQPTCTWRWVHVLGEETVTYAVEDGSEQSDTASLHGGWIGYASAPDGGVYIANAITDPFLFASGNTLHTTRSEDLHTYIVNGTHTLTQVFLNACGYTGAISDPLHCVLGYSSHNTGLDEETVQRVFNLTWLNNASTTRMGGVQTAFGITVSRLYSVLRHEFAGLTASGADVHFRPAWMPGMLIQLDDTVLEEIGSALADHPDFDDAALDEVWEATLDLLNDELFTIPHMVLCVALDDPATMHGVAYSESPALHTRDASKWVLGHVTHALVGLDYAAFSDVCDAVCNGFDLVAELRATAPTVYTDPRSTGDNLFPQVVPSVARAVVPLVNNTTATVVVDMQRLPPWTGLRVIPTIVGADIAHSAPDRLIDVAEFRA